MSHDRGCYACGKDRWEYSKCIRTDCPKADIFDQMWKAKEKQIIDEQNRIIEIELRKIMKQKGII